MNKQKLSSLDEWLVRQKVINEVDIEKYDEQLRSISDSEYVKSLLVFVSSERQMIREMNDNYFSGLPKNVEDEKI